jgi:hypothetical protein
MAKHDIDPVLKQLIHAVNESGQAAVPVTVSVGGSRLHGVLIAERRYFSDLVKGSPLMSALDPSSGLLGKEYVKETEAESGHHLHLRDADGLWRISLESVDGWSLSTETAAEDDRGPFARLLGSA